MEFWWNCARFPKKPFELHRDPYPGVKGLNGTQASAAPTDFTQKLGGQGLRPECPTLGDMLEGPGSPPRIQYGGGCCSGLGPDGPQADMLDFSWDLQWRCILLFFYHKKIFFMKVFCPSPKKVYVASKQENLKAHIKPICLPGGGQLGLRPTPPPFCVKFTGAPGAGGPLRPAIPGLWQEQSWEDCSFGC